MNANQLKVAEKQARERLDLAKQRLDAVLAAMNGEPVEQRVSPIAPWSQVSEPQFLLGFDYRPCR